MKRGHQQIERHPAKQKNSLVSSVYQVTHFRTPRVQDFKRRPHYFLQDHFTSLATAEHRYSFRGEDDQLEALSYVT